MKADLHIHTVLSPCGDLEMSPSNIINKAKERGIDVIGIADHNSTRQAPIIQDYGKRAGITVLTGVEVNTREEVHALAFFPTLEKLEQFQIFLDTHLPNIPNNPDKFGYQVVVDEDDQIIFEEERLLISALDISIDDVEKLVHKLDGFFIPAHINRSHSGILSQLGFIPPELICDALEVSRHITIEKFISENSHLRDYAFITSSDAHYIEDVGAIYTELPINDTSFDTIKSAIQNLKRE